MNRILTTVVALFLIAVIVVLVLNAIQRALPKKTVQPVAVETVPEWTSAHSLLLNIDYQFKTDALTVVEGDDLDYSLNLIADDWSMHVHKLAGFARAFITGKPSGELYQLIGDSDLFRWQQAWGLTTSEPTYTIYIKDEAEHLRQDFTLDVSPASKLPSYFPKGLSEQIAAGKVSKLAIGNFYYISAADIFMIHFVSPYPLGDRDDILVETVKRMTLNLVPASDDAAKNSVGESGDSDTGSSTDGQDSTPPSGNDGEDGAREDGDGIDPLPLPH